MTPIGPLLELVIFQMKFYSAAIGMEWLFESMSVEFDNKGFFFEQNLKHPLVV